MTKTPDAANPSSQSSPPGARRRPFAWVWRILAIFVILVGAIWVADHFRAAARSGTSPGGASGPGGDAGFSPTPPPAQENPGDVPGRSVAEANLRRMAGILMHATDENGEDNNAKIKDPKERQRILSEFFGMPFQDPQSEAPQDMVPPQAQVLAVFDSPEGHGARMILLRMKVGVEEALSQVYAKYTAGGWKAPDPLIPGRQTDEGWLVRYTQPGRERIVYARPRQTGGETLLAVYDSPH